MIRVLHCLCSLIGGAAEHVLALLENLDSARYTLYLAAPRDFPPVARRIDKLPVKWLELPIDSGFHPRALARLTDFIRREKIDIVHSHGIRAGTYARLAALLSCASCSSLYTIHGFHTAHYTNAWKRRIALWWERELAKRATDGIICVSEADEALVKSHLSVKVLSDIVSLVPNGISFERFEQLPSRGECRERFCVSDNEIVLGTLGRLRPQKSVETLVDAAKLLKNGGLSFKMLIAGEGFLEESLRARIAEHGLESEVRLLGYREDVPEFLKSLDVFLLASLWEGLPLVLLEAIAAGVPVIATDVPGSRELLEPDLKEHLVAPQKPEAFVEKILDCLNQRTLWMNRAELARVRIRDEFGVQRMVEKTEEIYERLLKRMQVFSQFGY